MNNQSDSSLCELSGIQKASRPASGISFAGFETFDEVQRGFEFSRDHHNRRGMHHREESAFSIASVSTYGRVVNNGVNDPSTTVSQVCTNVLRRKIFLASPCR